MKEFLITHLDELVIPTKIGVSEEERAKPQQLKISFKLYQTNPEIFESDSFEDYNCYANISKLIAEYCSSRSFKLLEYLCYNIHNLIKKNVSVGTLVHVEVQKNNISYEGLKFNAKAEYSDL